MITSNDNIISEISERENVSGDIVRKYIIPEYVGLEEVIQGLFQGNTSTTMEFVNTHRATGELHIAPIMRQKKYWLLPIPELQTIIDNSREC